MLSFILPIYKKNNILEKTLKALIDQSLKDWELIAVLDGPDAEAERIIHHIMKKRPNVYKVVNIEHGGASRARNEGFKHSKGEYIIFFDADCIIEPHAAKAWVDIFDREPQTGFIYSGYTFLNEQGAINSEVFDPWLLRVSNYISSCFPLRRSLFPGWNENLKSLQDWDFWLKVVERGGIGKFMKGYAWSTELPTINSISGQGCTDENWLERMDAVRELHNIPERDICVSSLNNKYDAIALAKYIDADYRDIPNYKPNRYKTVIQVGFSLNPSKVEIHSSIFNGNYKKVIFWQPDDIYEIYNRMSFVAIRKYSILLNNISIQYVEDKTANDMMMAAGFNTQILPMPMHHSSDIQKLPDKPRFAVDIDPSYGDIFRIIDKSLPDISLEPLTGNHAINDYTGIVHFFSDRTLSNEIKRAMLTGRHVISNVKAPFTGFINENVSPEYFIKNIVQKIRETAIKDINISAKQYYDRELDKKHLLEVMGAK